MSLEAVFNRRAIATELNDLREGEHRQAWTTQTATIAAVFLIQ
jgi:hypothetical protein